MEHITKFTDEQVRELYNKVHAKQKKLALDDQVEESNSSRFAKFFRQHWAQNAGPLDSKTIQDIYNKLQVSALKKIKPKLQKSDSQCNISTESTDPSGDKSKEKSESPIVQNIDVKNTESLNIKNTNADQNKESSNIQSTEDVEQSKESSDKEPEKPKEDSKQIEAVTPEINTVTQDESTLNTSCVESQNENILVTPPKKADNEQTKSLLQKQLSVQSFQSDYSLLSAQSVRSDSLSLQRNDSRETIDTSIDEEMEEDVSSEQVEQSDQEEQEPTALLDKSPYIVNTGKQHTEN